MKTISSVDKEIKHLLADLALPMDLDHSSNTRQLPSKITINLDDIIFSEVHSLKSWADPYLPSILLRTLTPKDNISAYTPTLEYFVSKIGCENNIFYYLKPWLSHPHNNSPPPCLH